MQEQKQISTTTPFLDVGQGFPGHSSVNHSPDSFQLNIHPSDIELSTGTVFQTSTSTDQVQMNCIPLPKVDLDILATQKLLFKNMWPSLTDTARTASPEFAALYDHVKSYNLPNFLGAKCTVPSGLNIQQWEIELATYHDREICHFLRCGWPVGYHLDRPPVSVQENHASARMHDAHVKHCVDTELAHKAIAGPFSSPPFQPWTRLSPLMTRPKRDSDKRRVIVDMSFPDGHAVNDGIKISSIYGRDTTYTLPSIKDLASLIQKAPATAWLWNTDLARAYRQLRVDPIDTPLLGFGVDSSTYIDLCPSFGCRSSSGACQRVSAAVSYIMARKGFQILAFLDDFAGCEDSFDRAMQAYLTFLELAAALGLQLAHEKCQAPSTRMQWLGYDVSSANMSIAIPQDRLSQVLEECKKWVNKTCASRSSIQSIGGKLVYLANCVRHARKFTARILSTLRSMNEMAKDWTTLSQDFKADIRWFLAYSELANGVSLISPICDYIHIECDSSLVGGGGNSDCSFYKWKYPSAHIEKYPSIHMLEAINLLVAYRTLCPRGTTAGKCIVIATDNLASHYALSSGRTKDPVLGACARELWLEAACADHQIEIIHKEGTLIPLADALSRYYSDPAKATISLELANQRNLSEIEPILNGYTFFNEI